MSLHAGDGTILGSGRHSWLSRDGGSRGWSPSGAGSVAKTLKCHASKGTVVISGWESTEAARRFWKSPEHTQAELLREGPGRFNVLLKCLAA